MQAVHETLLKVILPTKVSLLSWIYQYKPSSLTKRHADLQPVSLISSRSFCNPNLSVCLPSWRVTLEKISHGPCRFAESRKFPTRVTTAYETPSDFAFAFPRLESLDVVLKDLDETTIQALNLPAGTELLSSLPAARLKKAPQTLSRCHDPCPSRQLRT